MKTHVLILAMLLTAIVFAGFTIPDAWVKLGSRTAKLSADFDEIIVTGRMGTFSALKLHVEKADLHIHRIVVHYRNGGQEELHVRANIPAGGYTRVLDLKGRQRVIRRVVFFYQSVPGSDKKSRVTLWGRK